MSTDLQASQKNLYETDYLQWIDATVKQLRAKDFASVDWDNLIEEIEDMSRRERKSLKSNLIIVLLHLLKWQYQPEQRSGSWRGSIREHRRRINDDLKDSPSLLPYLQAVFDDCYANARAQAADETEMPLDAFPSRCPYTPEQVLESDYLTA
ncbi:DUF29 domain-containing protein [filamentous cyanobacterium CCP5]|nr:DUF29 domain-containing protein [filamentous cyanobacterium CCP5]